MLRPIVLPLTALLLAAGCATAPAPTARDDSLYQAFGGQPGLTVLMDDFMVRLLADARMKPFFEESDHAHVKKELVTQLCQLSGGPCQRNGPDMTKSHSGLDITRADFNALVEVLQDRMDARGIGFGNQNRMLALLAPMHRQIVNTP